MPKRDPGQDGGAERPRPPTRRKHATPASNSPKNQAIRTKPTTKRATAKKPGTAAAAPTKQGMRIAKAIARAGLCSRRDAERWIADGRVMINGEKIVSPARDVLPSDHVTVDGNPLPDTEPAQLWRYHKPRGLVTTHRDPEGRPTVFDNLPEDLPRVISIGRLDFNTEGLLLLTTDGGLARHIELPSTGWLRRYRVRAHGKVTQADLDALAKGATIDGVNYGPIEATLDSEQGRNSWLTLGLREGKNREVRNILASLGLEVNRLIRISFGPFQLLDLEPGTAEPVKRRVLVEQLGKDVAESFGLKEPQKLPVAETSKPRPSGRKPGKPRPPSRKGTAQPSARPSSKPAGRKR